jgi:hypothetical protein
VKQGGIHCYAGRLRPKAEAGSALRQDRHAGNLYSGAGAWDTGGRCMVPGSCKGVFPKRLTGQRPANRKRDREGQQRDAERLWVPGGLPEVPVDTQEKAVEQPSNPCSPRSVGVGTRKVNSILCLI